LVLIVVGKNPRKLMPNSFNMVKVAVLTSWATICFATEHFPDFKNVVEPQYHHILKLSLSMFDTYARMIIDADGGTSDNGLGSSSYNAAIRDISLPVFSESWARVLEAFTLICSTNNSLVAEMFHSNTADAPSKNFFKLLGLCVEALAHSGNNIGSLYGYLTIGWWFQ
jgi:hypothetical protein